MVHALPLPGPRDRTPEGLTAAGGPPDTEFFDRPDLTDTRLGTSHAEDDPAQVARQGYEGLMDGEASVFAG